MFSTSTAPVSWSPAVPSQQHLLAETVRGGDVAASER
jgi:hypothetical protein